MSEESQEQMDVKAGTNMETGEPAPQAQGDWRERIPAEYRDAGYWKNVHSEADLMTQFAELQKYRGQSIKVPKADDPDDAWSGIYEKLGRPETPEGYDVKLRDYDGQLTWTEGSEEWLRSAAHDLGLNSKQTQKLADKYGELILASATEAKKQQNAAIDELRGEYGDLYERKITLGERAMKKVGGDEFLDHMREMGWNHDPHMVRTMIKLGSLFEESNWIDGRVGSMGRADAEAKLRDVYSNTQHPYWDGNHPDHGRAVHEVMQWQDIVYGG